MTRFSTLTLTLLLTGGLLLVGCDSSGSTTESTTDGTMDVTMTDGSTSSSPSSQSTAKVPSDPTTSDVDTALVPIEKISIVSVEDSAEDATADVGVQVLSDSNFTIDLIDLQQGISAALTDIDISAGDYSQIRLVTADNAQVSFTNTNGTTDVKIASGQQTGLKANVTPFTVDSADDRVDVIVNWDVNEALKGNPNGQYVITPVVQVEATVTSVTDDSTDGSES